MKRAVHLAGTFIPLDPDPRGVDYYDRPKQRPAFRASLGKRA